MKKRNYSVNIVSDDPRSVERSFRISSKQIRHALLAFFILIVMFGFFMFDSLITSFDKGKIKRLQSELQNRIIEQEKVIIKLEKEKRNSIMSKPKSTT